MFSIHTVAGVLACGFLLYLSLSSAVQAGNALSAAEEMNPGQSSDKRNVKGQNEKGDQLKGGSSAGGETINGEVMRVEGDYYFVKGQDGKEVGLHSDHTTQKTGKIQRGDRIEAEINDQNHALSIRSSEAVTRPL